MSIAHRAPTTSRHGLRQNRRARHRKIWAALTSVLLTVPLVSAVFAPSVAMAAPNPAIKVDQIVIGGGTGPDGQLIVGDKVEVNGTWDATEAEPEAGDEFTIELPAELGFPEAFTFPLTGDGVEWAICALDPATSIATCTLTDAVEDRPEEVQGTFQFEVEAVAATTAEKVEFDLNGEPVMVDLPGEGGIDDGIDLSDRVTKSGAMRGDKTSMNWTVELPGKWLADMDQARVLETLSSNHELCDDPNVQLRQVRGDDTTNLNDRIEVDDTVADHDFAFNIEGPFDSDYNYVITYTTCTTSGEIDDKGETYDNEVEVEGWTGPEGAGIGVGEVVQDWDFGGVTKRGEVRDRGDRNGVIDWTVRVSAVELAGKDSFKLSENLGGPHSLCTNDDGDYVVQGLKIEERHGPNTVVAVLDDSVLDPEFTIAADGKSFDIDFEIVDSDFSFKTSDKYVYRIVYQTCATTDGLPAAGTVFENEVSVDGELGTTGSAKVPTRSEGKSGQLNNDSVTIDGEEYFGQTTLDWTIRIPGEVLADLDEELTLTDTITGEHQICESDGDLKDRLNLKFEARDQVAGGGLATQDLTDSVAVDTTGDGFEATIPQPQGLPLPDGGTADGFSHEYQYLLTYTTCTTSGGMDAPGTTYGNTVVGHGVDYQQTVKQERSFGGTGTGVTRGSIAIKKLLDEGAPGADFVADDEVFTVYVEEFAPNNPDPIASYNLSVPLNGDFVNGLNPRGNGWTVRLSEPTFPNVPGVVFGEPVFSGDGVDNSDGVAIVPLTPGSNIEVALTNSTKLGSLDITKEIDGGGADEVDPYQTFDITAQIDVSGLGDNVPAQEDREFEISPGQTVTLDNLPIGATVSFSETLPADDDTFTWGEAVISPESIVITEEHADEAGAITVTNHVERTVGTFSLSKQVVGAQANNPAVPAEVTVNATWDEEGAEGSKTLTLPTDGSSVSLGEDLLIGTDVHLTEVPLTDGSSIAWGAPVWSGAGVSVDGDTAVVTIGRDGEAHVTLENHAATSTAGLSFVKGISGEAADEVDSATEFPVTVTWTDEEGETQTRELTINSEEPTPLGEELLAGTEVTITEGESPEISTVSWGQIVISGSDVDDNGDGSATVIVSDQQDDSTLITVTNEATWAPGTFSLAKEITGVLLDNPDVPDTVEVTASWLDTEGVEQTKQLEIPTDGSPVDFGEDLPYLTEVTLTETPLENAASFTWDAPEWTGENVVDGSENSAVVTIAAGELVSVSLTNNATEILGSLDLTKELVGSGAGLTPSGTVFPVTATWTDLLGNEQSADIDVEVGKVSTMENLPFGVEVTLTEQEADLPDVVDWVSAEWSTDNEAVTLEGSSDSAEASVVVVGEAGSAVSVSLTNTVEDITPAESLPRTGAEVLAVVGGGLLLILVGIGVYRIRRYGLGR